MGNNRLLPFIPKNGPYIFKSGDNIGKSPDALMFEDYLQFCFLLGKARKQHKPDNYYRLYLEALFKAGENIKPTRKCFFKDCRQSVTHFSVRYSADRQPTFPGLYTACAEHSEELLFDDNCKLFAFKFSSILNILSEYYADYIKRQQYHRGLLALFKEVCGLDGKDDNAIHDFLFYNNTFPHLKLISREQQGNLFS